MQTVTELDAMKKMLFFRRAISSFTNAHGMRENFMKVQVNVNVPEDFAVFFEEEEFEGLSERDKALLIREALSGIVMDQVTWFSVVKDEEK